MASTFKNFLNNDIASTRTLLHEAIPITGSIVSGTYLENGDIETNIKNYSHGMFQSVFDYPHLSSSANHIFDVAMGYSSGSALSGSGNVQNAEKINIYNQMAQILVGTDLSGNIKPFDRNGRPFDIEESARVQKMDSVFFLNFARLLTKDEIKKGSISIDLYTGTLDQEEKLSTVSNNNNLTRVGDDDLADGGHFILQDHGGSNSFFTNSPAGEYGLLYSQSADLNVDDHAMGIIYYQAGIAVITSSVFRSPAAQDARFSDGLVYGSSVENVHNGGGNFGTLATFAYDKAGFFGGIPNSTLDARTGSVEACFVSASISASCYGFRQAVHNISFNNTTELNSTIYFCRASHNEYNYSSNPTYIDNTSKIRVKETSFDQPVTYITSIGLYSADNELLAVAKLSEPIKKTPENELTFRVRLDY
jgi:hypothetical protein